MDQQKIGTFLKELRNEKNLTQEQLAEILGVSRRTVSRWETGSNLPDLDVLIEMVDYYDVDMRELLSGERKSEKMNKELEETVIMLADYSNEEKKQIVKMIHWLFIAAVASFIIFFILLFFAPDKHTFISGLVKGAALGTPFASVCVGALITGKHAAKLFKKKVK